MAQPRFQIRRVAGKIVVACSQELAAYAEKLGQVADELAAPTHCRRRCGSSRNSTRCSQPQQPHGCQPFSNERLLKLAAAMSKTAAVSSRQELYPRGMAAERALRLGIGALQRLGSGRWRGRLHASSRSGSGSRAAIPKPSRCRIARNSTSFCDKVGLDVRWDPETTTYHRREASILVTSGSSIPEASTRRRPRTRQVEDHARDGRSPAVRGAAAARLRRRRVPGAHRAAQPDAAVRGRTAAAVRWSGSRSTTCSSTPCARRPKELEVDWSIIEQADGADPSSQDWYNLMHLVGRVAPKITADLCTAKEHLLLVHPGLIARYDQMSILETLRDKVGHDVPCPGLWVLVATDGQNDMPMLDHAEIPLITPGQRAKVSEGWIDNVHRGRAKPVAAAESAGAKERRLSHGRHQDTPAGSEGTCQGTGRGSCSPVRPENAEIDAGLREAFQQIEKGGRTAQAFEVWREDYLDQVAVAWVLACVFVRFMEDNHLIDECWLAGEGERRKLAEDTHELFFRKHPHDTDREYFQHVFHEVGKIPAAKDLFAEGKTPLWAVAPSGDAAMKLLTFWREMRRRDRASQAVVRGRGRRHPLPGRPVSGAFREGEEEVRPAANARVRRGVHPRPDPHTRPSTSSGWTRCG